MEYRYDFLIIGTGIAGLFYALKTAELNKDCKIAIVTKKTEQDTSTNKAQGGIAAVLSNTDSFDSHINDTLSAGQGLCDKEIVTKIVESGPSVIKELMNYGVKFTPEGDTLAMGREGGHSHSRVVHAADFTGQEIERGLLQACRAVENIDMYRNHIALDLIQHTAGDKTACYGAFVFCEEDQSFSSFYAPVTMLASGGLGQIYFHNTNPKIATGDGVAIAYRAGCSVGNLEFIQFHPTTLYNPGRWPFLISEAVRGEGGRLLSVDGRYIMENEHALKDLAPRDVVARAIDKELKESGEEYVLLDISHLEKDFIIKRFPTIYNECLKRGFDITKRDIPVVPAAHYSCGGVVATIDGETDLDGLFVAGEVAHTGMHGANRLASNSLLEAVVMAKMAATKSSEYFKTVHYDTAMITDKTFYSSLKYPRNKILIAHDRRELTRVMSDFVGIVRSKDRLLLAQEKIQKIHEAIEQYYLATPATYGIVELRNMATVANLVIQSALMRLESRGLHYMEDYPQENNSSIENTIILGRFDKGETNVRPS